MPNNPNRKRAGAEPPPPTSANKIVRGKAVAAATPEAAPTQRVNDPQLAPPGTPATGANPSASVGLTAVNGAAVTFMRSDAAPALSQAIIPTWTAKHTFSLPPQPPTYAVGALPAAPGTGARAMVTDAIAPAFGAAVVGGGAAIVPVYFTGVAWNVG